MTRKTNGVPAVLIVSAVILLAVGSSAHARFLSVAPSHPQMGNGGATTAPVRTSSHPESGRSYYGYGRGWCYWHPYACYRAQ